MDRTVDIRVADVADAGRLAELGAATFVETYDGVHSEQDRDAFLAAEHSPEAYARFLDDPGFRVWIAEAGDGEAVGYCVAGRCGLPVDDRPPNAGELKRIYVRSAWKGRALGGRMLDTALAWMREAGYGPVYLSVLSENVDAQRFYAKHGFDKIKEFDFPVGDHTDREFLFERRASNRNAA